MKANKVKGLTTTAQRLSATAFFVKQSIKPKLITKPTAITKLKTKPPIIITKTSERVKQGISQLSNQEQRIKQRLRQLTKAKQKTKTKLAQRSLQQQRQKLRLKLKTLQAQKQKLTQIRFTPKFVPTPAQIRILKLALLKRKKKIKKKIKPKKKRIQSFNVLARPLKKKGKKKPKLVRVTKRPIKKSRAKDLRNYLVDTSLSRTAKIKGSARKPSKRILKSPKGYASKTRKKFRKYKIVKGKRKPLTRGKVIERKRHLLDTKQERQSINLRKRIAQLQKQSIQSQKKVQSRRLSSPPRLVRRRMTLARRTQMLRNLKKARRVLAQSRTSIRRTTTTRPVIRVRSPVSRRKPVRRVPSVKRKSSPAQLRALAKGRAKLKRMRRKR